MKIKRNELRKIIAEVLEGYGLDTASKKREVGGSSFEKAQSDSRKNGKAYFVKDDSEVITFEDGEPNIDPNMTQKDAYEANDGTVHYKGNL